MSNVPHHLQDAKECLSNNGFRSTNLWYHGTSSALVDSIKANGLLRSGDKLMKQAKKQTMATIGNQYTETLEPVFLTQCKELAYYWANETVKTRATRAETAEEPVVIAIELPDNEQVNVKPDVGAASLLMIDEGQQFMEYLSHLYQVCGLPAPDIDLMKAERQEYLNKLGMAYINKDIDASHITEVKH